MRTERQPLVGRARELELLRRALDSTSDGHGAIAVVSGEPGIGKTRLLAELSAHAESGDTLVLTGRASEFEGDLPFGVFVDALDDYLRSLSEHLFEDLDYETRGELALVFPALRRADLGPEGPRSPTERVHAYAAMRALLERLATGRRVLLVVDDLHWADRGSLELVAHLLRRPPQGPILIVAAYRDNQADPDLSADVARAALEGTVTYVELPALAIEDTARLIDVPAADAERLHRLTGGNPFYLLELARSGPETTTAAAEGTSVPPVVAQAIVQELRPRSPAAQELATAGAVAGDPFDLDVAVAASGLSEAEALPALDELAECGLLRAVDVPRRFAFRHPLVRQAIYVSVPPGRRLAAHDRCAAALADLGAPPAARAHHLEHAARPGDMDAVAVLAEAAAQASARAPASAAQWLRAGQRLLPADADPGSKLELILPLPGLYSSLGDLVAARESLLDAIELVPTERPEQRVELATACAATEQLLGRHEEAHRRLISTLESLPSGAGRAAVAVMIALVMDGFYRHETDSMVEWGRRAAELAHTLDDRVLRAAANGATTLACALTGRIAEAETHRAVTIALVDELSDDELAGRLDALGHLTGAELYLDHYESAATHARRGLAIGRAAGVAATAPTLIPSLGTATWVLGQLHESQRVLAEAVESSRAIRDAQGLSWHLFNLAFAQLMAGEIKDARRSGDESLLLARELGDSVIATWAGVILAAAQFEDGDPATAIELLREAGGGDELPRVPGGWRTHLFELATRCWVALDCADEAELAAARARALAEEVGLPYARSMAERAAAACALHRGEPAHAAEHALAAVAAADEIQARVDAARARIVAGRALGLAGERERAVVELRKAAQALDAFGARRFRDEAERELGRLGNRPHRRTDRGGGADGIAALTQRELEVAELVVDRRTNPEIAELLFLSPKTVETHLRNIFRKLDVTSRADVARAIEAHRAEPEASA